MTFVDTSAVGLHFVVAASWRIEPLAAAGLLAGALLYLAAINRLSLKGRHWPWRRTAPFFLGLVTVVVATQSPLASLDTTSFTAHVIQHLLLSMAAPALLALGAPITLFLQGAHRTTQRRLLKILHSAPVKVVTFPLISWLMFVGSLFVLYYTGLYELSLRNVVFHEFVHIHFLIVGFLFFAPVIAIDPHPWTMAHGARLLYVGLTLPAHAFLALALMSATGPLAADWYLAIPGASAESVLTEQKFGAGVMWIAGDLIAIATVAIVVTQWAKQEDRAAVREDRHVDLVSRTTSEAALSDRRP